jgi:hypothetical protein
VCGAICGVRLAKHQNAAAADVIEAITHVPRRRLPEIGVNPAPPLQASYVGS